MYNMLDHVKRLYQYKSEQITTDRETSLAIAYFFTEARKMFIKSPLKPVSDATMIKLLNRIPYIRDLHTDETIELDTDIYLELIFLYFKTDFPNCDYSFAHFMSGYIRTYRYYEYICGHRTDPVRLLS